MRKRSKPDRTASYSEIVSSTVSLQPRLPHSQTKTAVPVPWAPRSIASLTRRPLISAAAARSTGCGEPPVGLGLFGKARAFDPLPLGAFAQREHRGDQHDQHDHDDDDDKDGGHLGLPFDRLKTPTTYPAKASLPNRGHVLQVAAEVGEAQR